MVTADKIPGENIALWATILIAVLLISNYGKRFITWILMKLYDLFIGGKEQPTSVS